MGREEIEGASHGCLNKKRRDGRRETGDGEKRGQPGGVEKARTGAGGRVAHGPSVANQLATPGKSRCQQQGQQVNT